MLLAIISVLGGLILLVLGADRFVSGAVNTAHHLGVSTLVIGLTIVGVATSAPEVFVGSVAALDGKTTMAIGNALGSNIANIGLVLGATALYGPLIIKSQTLGREFFMMGLAMLLALLLMLDQALSRMDGIVLLLSLVAIIGWVLKLARQSPPINTMPAKETQKAGGVIRPLALMLFALIVLLGGAELLVRGAVYIARAVGVSDLVIGLTIIAVGTSLPELAASIMSVIKNETDIAVGNIIGSNMFNMLMVLGIPCIIHPDTFAADVLWRDFPIMIALTLLMGWMVFSSRENNTHRWAGAVLLACFLAYQYGLFQTR